MFINIISLGSAQSSMSWNTYLSTVTGNSNTASGVAITDSVACDTYKYYGFQIPSPCYDLNLALTTLNGVNNGVSNAVAEFSVGTYPNNQPNGLTSAGYGESIEWTSYNWGDQDLTISAFDPNFEGGYNCGPNKDQLCTLIIGVYAYCVDPALTNPVSFTFTPTLTRAKKIFGTPQTSQTFTSQVSGGDVNTYEFCVLNNQDVTSQLQSYYASCNCQSKYVDLEMWISKYNSEATINDLVWRVGHGSADKTLHLNTADSDTRTGSYYLYVSGYCDNQCSSGSCTCYPCNNLVNTQYAVNVDYTSSMQSSNLLPDCGNAKTCHDQCDNTFVLSDGAKAGIAIGVIVFSMLVGALAYIIYQKKIRKRKWVPDTTDEEVELTFAHRRDQESLPSRSL